MRPWTIVVLSDYGRDRLAYQNYDLLFDPELPARDLPVGSRHVIRMQAVYATMDWLGNQLEGLPAGGVWQDLAQPWDRRAKGEQANVRVRQERIAAIMEELLTRPERQEDLARYLQAALRVSPEDIDAVFWDPPRPLLTAVLPTLARRLRRQWRTAASTPTNPALEFFEPNAPLPEFVPRALFQELNLPEVTVVTDPQQAGDEERRDPMPVSRALAEFAPGRVSRRYGIMHRYARHWVAPPTLDGSPEQDLPIGRFLPLLDEVATCAYHENGEIRSVRCVRPWVLKPSSPPQRVLDSANAFPEWHTQIQPEGEGIPADVPRTSPWAEALLGMRFFSHRHRCPVEIRRFATGSRATINFEDGSQFETRIRFVSGETDATPVAVGFACTADAISLQVKVPPEPHRDLLAPTAAHLLRSLRPAFFFHRVKTAPALDGLANIFARQWLAQAYLCALVRLAVTDNIDLATAAARLREQPGANPLGDVLDALFRVLPPEVGPNEEDEAAGVAEEGEAPAIDERNAVVRQRTHTRLLVMLAEPIVREALDSAATILWEPAGPAWDNWLTETLLVTVGAAAQDAVQTLCPEIDAKDLLVDPSAGPSNTARASEAVGREVWLTESAVGGGGVVERFQARFAEDPRRFYDLMARALAPSDFERTDEQLTRFVGTLAEDDALRDAVAGVRDARERSHLELRTAFDQLLATLRERRFLVTHPVVAGLNARILRPGSTPELDRLLRTLLARWTETEQRLGVELDARTFAWLSSEDRALDTALGPGLVPDEASETWRFGVLYSLFWPRGGPIRGQRLSSYNRYCDLLPPERGLALRLLRDPLPVVEADTSEWRAAVDSLLVKDGAAGLLAPDSAIDALRMAMLDLAAKPVDTGLLLSHPRIRNARKDAAGVTVVVELPEAAP
jgi:hypothetical protein